MRPSFSSVECSRSISSGVFDTFIFFLTTTVTAVPPFSTTVWLQKASIAPKLLNATAIISSK